MSTQSHIVCGCIVAGQWSILPHLSGRERRNCVTCFCSMMNETVSGEEVKERKEEDGGEGGEREVGGERECGGGRKQNN